MSGPEHDAELEAFLKRRSPIHRRLSDIDHAEPSLEMDRLVLNRAREAIETPAQPPMFSTTRWAMPLGLAATILIAFTVVLNIDRNENKVGTPVGAAAEQAASTTESAPAAQLSAPLVARTSAVRGAASANSPRVVTDSSGARGDARTQLAKKAEPQAATAERAETAEARVAGADTASPPPAAPTDPHATPEGWIREINRLRAAGKTAEADRELSAFRDAYPRHPGGYSLARPPTR